MSAHARPRPIGGPILDRGMITLLALFGVAEAVITWRFVAGLGAVSNMNDGYAWGIWEPVNVVVFTGIGAGALGVGLLTYVLNRGAYHPLVRPAVLLGAICYTLGGSSIMVALGRYWNALLLPVVPFWNLASALLEVAVCVLAYLVVLWIEVLPAILEAAAASRWPFWVRVGRFFGPWLQKLLPYFVAAAVVLPVMHQSSLGGLMLIPETKVHPLWHTALLPLLFLVSCVSMGYGAVVALLTLLRQAWHAQADRPLLATMSRIAGWLAIAYLALRLGDVALSGKLPLLRPDFFGALFVAEIALFAVAAWRLLSPAVHANRGRMFGAGLLAVAAGAAYRVDAYLTVFRPGPGWGYFPSIGETVVTVGMAAIGILVFLAVARFFPVVAIEGPGHEAGGPKEVARAG